MKFLSLGFIAMVLMSCGAAVSIDYDEQIDFSQYQSYNYFPDIESGLNQLDDKRIMQASDSLLQGRGFVKSETPQILINFFAKEYLSNSRNTIGIGVGGGGGNVGVGVSGGIPIGGKVINQSLTVDFIDASNDSLIWQAVVDGEFKEKANPAQREAYYFNVLAKAFKKYPPKKN